MLSAKKFINSLTQEEKNNLKNYLTNLFSFDIKIEEMENIIPKLNTLVFLKGLKYSNITYDKITRNCFIYKKDYENLKELLGRF